MFNVFAAGGNISTRLTPRLNNSFWHSMGNSKSLPAWRDELGSIAFRQAVAGEFIATFMFLFTTIGEYAFYMSKEWKSLNGDYRHRCVHARGWYYYSERNAGVRAQLLR
jgi:hypothetical protein